MTSPARLNLLNLNLTKFQLKTDYKMAKRSSKRKGGKGGKSVTGSSRAGLIFPVGRCNRLIRKGRYSQRVGAGAGVFMAGVLEYLTMEMLDLAGQCAAENKKKTITPRHMQLAVRNDDELNKLLCDSHMVKGGVVSNVIKDLWPKNKM